MENSTSIADPFKYIEVEPGIHLHITDKGAGAPVVFIHGWPQSDCIFKDQYEDLAGKGYRAIGITLRGFGQSDKPRSTYNFDVFANDIRVVLEQMELENVVLVGYSMGGAIAVTYLLNFPANKVGKLVLLSANVPVAASSKDFPFGITPENFNIAIKLCETDKNSLTDVYGPLFQLKDDFLPRQTGDWVNKINRRSSPRAAIEGLICLRDFDVRVQLREISVPTAIFHGANDSSVVFEIALQAFRTIPNAQLVSFSKGGHWITLKEREKFLFELLKFIEYPAVG